MRGGNSITPPEDDLVDLAKRILFINQKIKSQIEALNQLSSSNKD